MTEIMQSWPWLDRFIGGALLFGAFYWPYTITAKLDRITELLQQINRRQ